MAFNTFSGPLRAGTVREGSARNTGLVVLAQSASVNMSGVAKTSGASAQNLFTLPAGAKILNFVVDVTTTISGNSVSETAIQIGKSGTADQFSASFNTGLTAARLAQATVDAGMAAKVANLDNIGTSDVTVQATFTATTGNPTAGAVKITCVYVQRDSAGNANPTSA